VPTRPCTKVLRYLRKIVFMSVLIKGLERLISFLWVTELSGRISILKSGIVPLRPY